MPQVSQLKSKALAILSNPGFRKYFFNTGWMFAEKILRLISGVFIGAYVARYLGPAKYGLLNYVVSLVSLFSVICYLGLEGIIIRELVREPKQRDALLGTAFFLRIVAAIVVLLALFTILKITNTDSHTCTLVYIISIGIVFEIFGVIDYFFQSKVWSKYSVWSQMTALVITSVLKIVFVYKGAPLSWFAWMSVIELAVLAIGLVFFYSLNNYNIFSFKFHLNKAKELLRISWPMMFSSVAITVYMRIDQIMIKWMLGDEANGHYGVAIRLSELWNFIPVAICASLFPAIINAKAVSEELYLKRFQNLYDLMVVISVAIALPMTFLSGFIIRLLFGDAYNDASGILTIYIWSGVFTFLSVANGKWILNENLQVFRMITLSIAAIMNIVLNYFLINLIGLLGAAVSTLISYSFASYFSFLLTKETRPVFVSMTRSFNPFRIVKILSSNG